jgi:hypothetical protein
VIAAPPGSHAWPNDPNDEQLPDYQSAPATFTLLLLRGVFQRGFARRWIDANGKMVAVRIFQFGLTEFAGEFAEETERVNEHHGWSAPAPVPAADGACTQVRPARKSERIHSIGVLVKDELVVLIDTSQPPPNHPTKLIDLVDQESELLH